MKKFLLICSLLLASLLPYARQSSVNWTSLICSDRTNFTLTTFLGDSMPSTYIFLDTTHPWNLNRFKLKEDVHDPVFLKKMERDEHHPYHHSYIFKDSMLDRQFPSAIKEQLYQQARQQKTEKLPADKGYSLAKKYKEIPRGFFFASSGPVFTPDQQFCFIDIEVLLKTEETTGVNDAYFGTVLLIYQNDNTGHWKRWKKIDRLIL